MWNNKEINNINNNNNKTKFHHSNYTKGKCISQ